MRCESFNGQEVRNLATFAELVDGCGDKYMKFGLEGGKLVILDRLQANEDAPRILQQHAITFDRSADLRQAFSLAYMLHCSTASSVTSLRQASSLAHTHCLGTRTYNVDRHSADLRCPLHLPAANMLLLR